MVRVKKILIFGNSGSGKSTLAKKLSRNYHLAHLDLDTLAWLPTNPPERVRIEDSQNQIEKFVEANNNWVIEGCYTDLMELLKDKTSEIIFLNLPISLCLENAKNRGWEPHKYKSKEAQDKNLNLLINWIKDYETREDVFSLKSHTDFYNKFEGKKTTYTTNVIGV